MCGKIWRWSTCWQVWRLRSLPLERSFERSDYPKALRPLGSRAAAETGNECTHRMVDDGNDRRHPGGQHSGWAPSQSGKARGTFQVHAGVVGANCCSLRVQCASAGARSCFFGRLHPDVPSVSVAGYSENAGQLPAYRPTQKQFASR
jgi:hypothetical protein